MKNRFTFNPYGVGAPPPALPPGSTWGYSPFGVEAFFISLSPGSTWDYSHSTPLGLGAFSQAGK